MKVTAKQVAAKLRELADVPHPEMKAHDSHGRIVVRNRNGDWVLTGERITTSTSTSASRELYRPQLSDDARLASIRLKLESDPKSFCGESVYRRFVLDDDELVGVQPDADHAATDGTVAHGTVRKVWPGKLLWHIQYDDGYTEDYDIDEMMAFCVERRCGNDITPALEDAQTSKPNPTPPDKCLCGCTSPVIVTVRDDDFHDVVEWMTVTDVENARETGWLQVQQ